MFKQENFKRLAGFLHSAVKVLFWASAVAAIISALGSVIFAFLPADYFYTGNTKQLNLMLDDVIRYRLDTPVSPVSLKPIFATILYSATLAFALLAMIFRPLGGILKTVKQDQPFAAENAKRLKAIGVYLLISSVIINAIQAAIVHVIVTTLSIQNIDINYSINITLLFMGLLLLILAGVFRYGNYLQDEVDSTL